MAGSPQLLQQPRTAPNLRRRAQRQRSQTPGYANTRQQQLPPAVTPEAGWQHPPMQQHGAGNRGRENSWLLREPRAQARAESGLGAGINSELHPQGAASSPPSVVSQQPATPQQRHIYRPLASFGTATRWLQDSSSMPMASTPRIVPSEHAPHHDPSTDPRQWRRRQHRPIPTRGMLLQSDSQGPVIIAQQPTLLQPNSTVTGAAHSTSFASGDAGDQQGTQTASAWLCVRQISPRSAAHVYLHQHPLDEATWLEERPVLRMTVEEGISFTSCSHIIGPWHNFHVRYNAESPPMFSEDIMFPNKVQLLGLTQPTQPTQQQQQQQERPTQPAQQHPTAASSNAFAMGPTQQPQEQQEPWAAQPPGFAHLPPPAGEDTQQWQQPQQQHTAGWQQPGEAQAAILWGPAAGDDSQQCELSAHVDAGQQQQQQQPGAPEVGAQEEGGSNGGWCAERCMYGYRNLEDLVWWLSDVERDRVMSHLANMIRNASHNGYVLTAEDTYRRLSCHWGREALLNVGLTRAVVLGLVDQPHEWVAACPISIAPPPSQAHYRAELDAHLEEHRSLDSWDSVSQGVQGYMAGSGGQAMGSGGPRQGKGRTSQDGGPWREEPGGMALVVAERPAVVAAATAAPAKAKGSVVGGRRRVVRAASRARSTSPVLKAPVVPP